MSSPPTKQYRYNIKKGDDYFRTNISVLGYCISQMRNGFSPLIIIVGKQRVGKSFIAVWLAYNISKFFNKEFDPIKNTFYDPEEVIKNLYNFQKQPIIIDEGGAVLSKNEWYSKIAIAMDKIVQTQGWLSFCFIVCSPFGADVFKSFRKHFDMMIYVRKKGVFVVKKIPKKYDDMTGKVFKPYWLQQVKIKKGAVPAELWAAYDKYSREKKKELSENVFMPQSRQDGRKIPLELLRKDRF